MSAKDKKRILDAGGKLPDKERDFWAGMTDAMRRDLAMLPVLLHEALAQLVEKYKGDVAPDLFHFLNVSASRAMAFHINPPALAEVLQSDCARFLKATNADDAQQAALMVAYLVLQLVEEGRIPDAAENQVVLASMAIMEEAKADGAGDGWKLNEHKVTQGVALLKERLTSHGYLTVH